MALRMAVKNEALSLINLESLFSSKNITKSLMYRFSAPSDALCH